MGLPNEAATRKFSIKVDSQELERIIQARKNLDDIKALAKYAAQYKKLGWSPVVVEAHSGTDLRVDFGQPQAAWLRLLMDLALKATRMCLAIRLEPDSHLVVLKVKPALARTLLDRLANWRSPCIARVGDIWEHHFMVLPQTWCLSLEHLTGDQEAPLSLMGPEQLVTVPPSLDSSSQETWRWLYPPWEQPPGHPVPELIFILEDCGFISRRSLTIEENLPSWKEIFPLICHSDKLLQALLAPEETSVLYYRKILYEAVRAGFQNPGLLLGLLWHAPHGEARLAPENWQQLCQWVAEIQKPLSAEASGPESGSPDGRPGSSGPTSASATPNGEIERPPISPLPRERPGSTVIPSSPENLMDELQFLAAQTQKLEQQLDKLENQRLSSESGSGGSPYPSLHEESTSLNLRSQEKPGELEELRQAVEGFLAKIQDLPDPE
jgi:hypothetical protein